MELRSYRAEDEQAAIELWNVCLPRDLIDRENFYKRIIYDVNFDPAKYIIACENGLLLGFVYGVKRLIPDEVSGMEPEKAWIVVLGVRPDCRRKGIGRALITAIEERLQSEGVKKIDVGCYATNYICPGVDKKAYATGEAFFDALGYVKKGESCSMDIDLHDYIFPERYEEKKKNLVDRGFTFKPFEPQDALSVFDFMRKSFPWWLPEVRNSVTTGQATQKLLLAMDASGATVGFVMRSMDGTDERFGPFGVSPSCQGTGLGSVLFNEMMRRMVAQRVFYTYFLWTNGRNLDIYATWGMKIYRTYSMMGKVFE